MLYFALNLLARKELEDGANKSLLLLDNISGASR